jgi:hypothetical protein
MAVVAPASEDDFISVPCNGARNLFIATHYGRALTILGCTGVGDTPSTGANYIAIGAPAGVAADRPGPIPLPAGVRTVSLRYKADHSFVAWCA